MPFTGRLVIFDFDGTLVDSQAGILAAMAAAFQAAGMPQPAPQEVRRRVGLSLEAAISGLLPVEEAARAGEIAEHYRRAFFALRQDPAFEEPLFPGVRETLRELARGGAKLAIATGKGLRGLEAALERHRLAEHFASLKTPDSCAGKPDPDMVLRTLAELAIGRERCLVVGDTTYDMEMARRAKVGAIGVGWGYHRPEELRAAGARRVLARFGELPEEILSEQESIG